MENSEYKVGSLLNFLGGGGSSSSGDGHKSQSAEDNLFTASKNQQKAEATPKTPKQLNKKEARDASDQSQLKQLNKRKVTDANFTSSDQPQRILKQLTKKRKKEKRPKKLKDAAEKADKVKGTGNSSEDEEVAAPPPPPLGSVKYEDNKQRVVKPEEDIRTIVVGNLPSTIKPKKLKNLFKPFGSVESVRLRCAARPDAATTKRLAVMQGNFHESRSNISAFVRFETKEEAEKACELNGSEFNGHHLRVDVAANAGNNRETRRAVFVGNLDFALEEETLRSHFDACGAISDVRIVRDANSGVGKGFAYVNFYVSLKITRF